MGYEDNNVNTRNENEYYNLTYNLLVKKQRENNSRNENQKIWKSDIKIIERVGDKYKDGLINTDFTESVISGKSPELLKKATAIYIEEMSNILMGIGKTYYPTEVKEGENPLKVLYDKINNPNNFIEIAYDINQKIVPYMIEVSEHVEKKSELKKTLESNIYKLFPSTYGFETTGGRKGFYRGTTDFVSLFMGREAIIKKFGLYAPSVYTAITVLQNSQIIFNSIIYVILNTNNELQESVKRDIISI